VDKARTVRVCDAVVDEVNKSRFGKQFTTTRDYLIFRKVEEVKSLEGIVIPSRRTGELVTRGKKQRRFFLDFGLRKKLDKVDDHYETDWLVKVGEDLEDFFLDQHFLEKYDVARCIEVEITALYSPKHLEELGVFISVHRLTFEELS
jgi:hypothetical protein